jgi:c-di-GMP-binding flagellar brake protein YcgR
MEIIMSDEREEKERRESNRIYFSRRDNISATIQTHAESKISLPVSLISISSGGLGFFCPRDNVIDIIKEGDQLTVTDIKTPPPLGPIASLGVEVKYILDYKTENRRGFGCNFNKISDALRNKIQNFVEYRLGAADKENKNK